MFSSLVQLRMLTGFLSRHLVGESSHASAHRAVPLGPFVGPLLLGGTLDMTNPVVKPKDVGPDMTGGLTNGEP